jgi:sigma-54 dependent transcriptional regulator, acetoin dehydrogenase operon transcriptional activator AcoR
MAPTLTLDHGDRGGEPPRATACLVLAFDGDAPLRAPTRWMLGDIDTVELGRAEGAPLTRRDGRTLAIGVPDRRVSTRHASLDRDGDGFVLTDRGSKNGTRIAGATVSSQRLRDGDVVELGTTFFVYRDAVAAPRDAVAVLDGRAAGVRGLGLATFDPELAARLGALADVAGSREPILVLGESGTGKEVVARAVHARSARPGPLVAVNCGALPDTLIESELYGHKKGAFSGAVADRDGLVRAADRGTLFLDEIGDLPLAAQAALLRVLQEREVVPVGATAPVRVDFRVVAATHRDLAGMIARGEFREDLYARLAGFTIRLPPLRERRQDLGLLIAALLERLAGADAGQVRFEATAARALFAASWPRNVRQLEKCLGSALALAHGEAIRAAHVELEAEPAPAAPAAPARPADVRSRLLDALARHHGNVSAVARELDTTRMQVHRWAKRFAIDLAAYRATETDED